MEWPELETLVGKLWHRWASKATSYPRYPEAAVALESLRGPLQVYFRGLGGPGAVRIASAADADVSNHRLTLRQRLGLGDEEYLDRARLSEEVLLLPATIDWFPDASLNRRLYYWLAGFSVYLPTTSTHDDDPLHRDLRQLQVATATAERLLQAWPGLSTGYRALCEAVRTIRPRRPLPPWEAGLDEVLRHCLGEPAPSSEAGRELLQALRSGDWDHLRAPSGYKPPLPVPVWAASIDFQHRDPGATRVDESTADGESAAGQDERRHRGRRRASDQTERRDSLILNRFEYLLSVAQMLNLNRSVEDDDLDNARRAADSLDELAIGQHSKPTASRLKLDLELAPQAVDEQALQGPLTYPEWDFTQQRYRPDHCRVVVKPASEEGEDWQPDAATRRRIRAIKRQFETLRPDNSVLPAQPDGDELDLEALIRSLADRRACGSGSDRLYLQSRPTRRDIAVTVLLDASLSTDAWVDNRRILDVEKEAVLALSQALAACGDNHSLLAFSSRSRRQVDISVIKGFAEAPGPRIDRRLQALTPGYYTRLGPALRHSAANLQQQASRQRLLLLLSDGKPNDADYYEGRYGIEDTRRAVRDIRLAGTAVFAITVDSRARDYVPYLFGPGGHAVVSRLARLPRVLPLIYRQITA